MKGRIKVVLAKLGLDVHNRGVITVAKSLSDEGMEVVYLGNAFPEAIVKSAIQEDADVIGVSSLGGAHLTLGNPLVEVAVREGVKEQMAFLMGGVFPPEDIRRLKDMGFDQVFTPGATKREIAFSIRDLVAKKRA